MKILELALHAFGPFTDVVLDLSGGQEGLHLIFGPNEAGKSSALRGLRQALFGIPAQSADDFVHSYAKMRIGLDPARRRRPHAPVHPPQGEPQHAAGGRRDDSAARRGDPGRFLNGLTESEFKSRFALDHDELVEGGKAILQGGGELGALLFQAGGGLKNLWRCSASSTGRSRTCSSPADRSPDQRRARRVESEAKEVKRRHVAAQRRVGRARDGPPPPPPRGSRRSRAGWRRPTRRSAGWSGSRKPCPSYPAATVRGRAGRARAGRAARRVVPEDPARGARRRDASHAARERARSGHRRPRSPDRRAGHPRRPARRGRRHRAPAEKGWRPTARRGSRSPRRRRSCSRPSTPQTSWPSRGPSCGREQGG